MALTEEQKRFWDRLGGGPAVPSKGQTLEQARAVEAHSFRHACMLEGVPLPTEEAVLAHMKE